MAHIYKDILNTVQKPVRYIGDEWNVIKKSDYKIRKRVALCFPDTYEIGMSHLGLRILYDILNKKEDVAAERVYTPWVDMEQKLRENALPLVSMETQMPLNQFDVVGFSLQYELEYTNILMMLDLGGIPFYAKDRKIDDPLVIAGGPCAFSPEPVADFFDAILIGDGEEAFPAVIDRFVALRETGMSRQEILTHLAHCDGVYVPLFYDIKTDPETGFQVVSGSDSAPFPVKRTYIEDINKYPFPADILVPHGDIVHDRVAIEIARGCTEGCRFCQAGTIYRPVRERTPESIINTIMDSLEKTGFDEASLSALSIADFSCIGPLATRLSAELEKRKTAMSVSSMRVYGMTDELGESLSKFRRAGFTIAPEAGSQRLRDVINKGITESVILGGADTAFKNGWSHVKLYFMIGLPTETEEDLKAIVDLGVKILRLAEEQHGRKAQVTISVSSHIPKPHTAFQWLGFEEIESLAQKQKFLRNRISQYQRLRFKWHDVEHSWLEAIFSRGDRRLSKAIELAYQKGCRFDAWTDQLKLEIWREVFDELEIDPTIWMKDIPLYSPLPWEHLDSLVKKDWLIRELKRSLKGRFSPACEKPYKKKDELDRTNLGKPSEEDKLVCYHCGLACDLDAIRKERIESWNSLKRGIPIKGKTMDLTQYPEADTRYRVCYRKLGGLRFLSALDLTRTFMRAFSRSQVPLKYSQGFHPAPIISFGPALPVGTASTGEYLDFETVLDMPENVLLQKVNEQLPDNLKFKQLKKIDRKAESLFRIIDVAEYKIDLNSEPFNRSLKENANGEYDGDLLQMHKNFVNKFDKKETVWVEKFSKGKKRLQDVKDMVKHVSVAREQDGLFMLLRLSTGSCGSVRPDLVLREIYGETDLGSLDMHRESLLVETKGGFVSPFEVSG